MIAPFHAIESRFDIDRTSQQPRSPIETGPQDFLREACSRSRPANQVLPEQCLALVAAYHWRLDQGLQ